MLDIRRKDSSRTNDNWVSINSKIPMDKFQIKNSFEELNVTVDVNLSEDEKSFFVQFAVVPVILNGVKGIILSDPYKRVPEFVVSKFSNFIFILKKEICSSLINEYLNKNELSLHFTKDSKPMESVKSILAKMETLKSSDVTLSWRRDSVCISYTINGSNADEYEDHLPHELADKIRITMINMAYENSAEKLIDGKFSIHINGDMKEYRLSVIETVAGYAIVLRSYQKFNPEMTLSDLGYLEKPKALIEKILEKNKYGIFLVTGPTGSGKTTTIYTIINEAFQSRNLKIKTAEDPVEIEISGIDQCQINKKGEEKHWVTYSNLLQSFMRQRPDIIVIGEIRDQTVAMATIEAALTGHVVISTLHTNNVEATFTRLINNLGITTDRIEDSVSGILSQRLVNKLCDCKIKDSEGGYMANEDGCPECKHSHSKGFKGLIPAVEIASLNKETNNFLKENFDEFYSYADCANELYESGFIDKKTKQMLELI